jgi:hypothetical protein
VAEPPARPTGANRAARDRDRDSGSLHMLWPVQRSTIFVMVARYPDRARGMSLLPTGGRRTSGDLRPRLWVKRGQGLAGARDAPDISPVRGRNSARNGGLA